MAFSSTAKIRPLPSGPIILRQDLYARINVYFLILINQFQVALALRDQRYNNAYLFGAICPARASERPWRFPMPTPT